MDDMESDAIAPDAPETGGTIPHADANPAADATDTPSPDATEGDEAEQTPEEELEFDFGGNKFKAPKSALPADLAERLAEFTKGTWQDYTRKSQEVAEARKAMEAERSAVQKLGSLRNDALTTYASGLQLKAEVEQLQQVDLNRLWQSNPDQARMVSDRLAQKSAEFQRVVARVNELENSATHEETAHQSRLIEEGKAKVAKLVKGFDEKALTDYAVKSGYTADQIKLWPTDPIGTAMAWKAMQYDAMQARAAKAVAPAAPPPAAPVQAIKGRSATSAADPEKMSDDQWLKWRNQQVRGRR